MYCPGFSKARQEQEELVSDLRIFHTEEVDLLSYSPFPTTYKTGDIDLTTQ